MLQIPKVIIFTLSFCILHFSILAQKGYYVYENKEDQTTTSLEIFEDGTFQYIRQGVWATSKTSGDWEFDLKQGIVLKSKFQVDDVNVREFRNEDRKGSIYITFTAENYKRGPKKIKSITINDHPGFRCSMDNDRVLADMEARNDLLTMGSKKDRDSAAIAYPNVYFECNAVGVDSIESIAVEFDDHQLLHIPDKAAANTFIFKMQLAPDQTYRYFNNEAFIFKKRYLTSLETGERFKKSRKP